MKQIFVEPTCYHYLETEGRCKECIYSRGVEYPFCKKHRYELAQMEGLLDFQTIPLTEAQEDYLHKKLEYVRTDFEFELRLYKRFRPTGNDPKKNPYLEEIIVKQQNGLEQEEHVPHQGQLLEALARGQYVEVGDTLELRNIGRFNRRDLIVQDNLFNIAHDSQNVHRNDIRMAQNPMLFDILKTNLEDINRSLLVNRIKEVLIEYYKEEGNIFSKIFYSVFGLSLSARTILFTTSLSKEMSRVERFSYLNPDTNHITRFTYKELADKIMYRILQSNHKKDLCRRFMEEVVEGVGYCMTGKITRLLNVFTGFPDFIQVDGRTQAERIQDAMVEINRMELAGSLKKERARIALIRLGVIDSKDQVPWLEAFGYDELSAPKVQEEGLRRRKRNDVEVPLLDTHFEAYLTLN
jgi:hypothetical protein